MRSLLTITALLEGVTGLTLAIVPSLVVSMLLGTLLTDVSAIILGRLAGAVLIAIAIACWLSKGYTQSLVMVKVMLVYNVLAITLFVYALLVERISGPALWPAVIIHFGLLVWCLSSLWKQTQKAKKTNTKILESQITV
jgi:hypothetical protein